MAVTKPRRASAKKDTKQIKHAALAIVGEGTKMRAADKARIESLLALIDRRKARISEDFYEIGKALREIQQKKLYQAIGFSSFADMLKDRDVLSLSTAKKLIAVVEALPVDKALSLGVEKAYALTRYTAVTPDPDSPALLIESNEVIGGKKVREASLRDLEQAAKEARKKAKPKSSPKPAADPDTAAAKKAARQISARLRERKIRYAAVTTKHDANHSVVIEIPMRDMTAFLALLS
ncbi:MAG: hypothetical protein U0441_28810 [Polyangiaceae bacterium]